MHKFEANTNQSHCSCVCLGEMSVRSFKDSVKSLGYSDYLMVLICCPAVNW